MGLFIGTYFSWKMTLWMLLSTPFIAFGQWIRSKATTLHSQMNAKLSNKLEHIVIDSISKMKTIRADGNSFDVSSLNNTDLGSNEALAHEMKENAKLFNNIDTKVEFVFQDLQALWADSEHGPRVKFIGKDDASLSCGRYHGQITETCSDHPEGATSCSETEQIAQRFRRP